MKLCWNHPEDVIKITDILRKNGVVLGSSDTVLGLMCRANEVGFYRLNSIKKRFEKPYIVLINSISNVEQLIDPAIDFNLKTFISRCWPGPVTLLLPARNDLPFFMTGGSEKIGIRIPQHEGLLTILKEVGPLFSTSANISAFPVPHRIEDVEIEIVHKVDAIILDDSFSSTASTILDCTGTTIRVVREGAFPLYALEELYGNEFIKK